MGVGEGGGTGRTVRILLGVLGTWDHGLDLEDAEIGRSLGSSGIVDPDLRCGLIFFLYTPLLVGLRLWSDP